MPSIVSSSHVCTMILPGPDDPSDSYCPVKHIRAGQDQDAYVQGLA